MLSPGSIHNPTTTSIIESLKMAPIAWHLVPEITRHLTNTETRFLLSNGSISMHNTNWDKVVMSLSLCRYGIKHYMLTTPFLFAMLKTAPYDAFVLPAITRRFKTHPFSPSRFLCDLICFHHPIVILEYMFTLYNYHFNVYNPDHFCMHAACFNNVAALSWLRDPTTGQGAHPWTYWVCLMAVKNNHLDMLQRLRNPHLDGGVCPWSADVCEAAARHGHLAILQRLRDPHLDGGACPWCKQQCRDLAREYNHLHVVAWIDTQPDDD